MSALTIVLADGSELSDRTRSILDAWTAGDLIRPALWVDLRQDRTGDHAAPIAASWIGGDEEVDLFRAIAGQPYGLCRLAVFQVVDRPEGDGPLEAAGRLHSRVERSLASTQRLVRLNVVVPAADVTGMSATRLSVHAEANVLAAPEDRITPHHASVAVRRQDELACHAAGVLATVAGLWTTMGDAPFDEETVRTSGGQAQVAVVRTFGRFLHIHGAVDDVTEELFELRRAGAWAASAAGGVGARDPQALVSRLVRQYLEKHTARFLFRPKAELVRPKLQTVGITTAFAMMLRYIAQGLGRLPADLGEQAASKMRSRLGEFAQRVTFGQDSVVAVTFGGKQGEGRVREPPASDATDATADLALRLLDEVIGEAPTPPAAGDSWRDLRRTVFGASDGGPMPEGIDEPLDGTRREIINNPRDLAPEPTAGPFVLDLEGLDVSSLPPIVHEPVRVCDVLQARTLEQVLDEAHIRAQQTATQADSDEDVQSRPEGDDELAARIRSSLEQLRRWIAAREGSFLWQVTERVSGALGDAQSALVEALRRVRQGEATLNESALERARRRLRRSWLLSTLLVGLVSWLVLAQFTANFIDTAEELAGYVTTSLVVWFVALLWAFVHYQRRMFQIQYEYDRAHADYLDAIERSIDSAQQVASLASIYDQLRDWAEIIGWLLHRPEGVMKREAVAATDVGDLPTPLSMVMAAGSVSEHARRRASALAGRRVFGRGWMSDVYARWLAASMANLHYEQGLAEADDTPDPDWDLSEPTPRRRLLRDLEDGRLADAWIDEVRSSVAGEMAAMPPNELVMKLEADVPDRVVDPAEFLSAILPAGGGGGFEEELALPLWTADARMRGVGVVGRHVVWAPEALDIPAMQGLEEREVAGGASVSHSQVFTMAAVRLDATNPVSCEDLAVFGRPVEEEVAAPAADLDDVW